MADVDLQPVHSEIETANFRNMPPEPQAGSRIRQWAPSLISKLPNEAFIDAAEEISYHLFNSNRLLNCDRSVYLIVQTRVTNQGKHGR